MGRLLQTSLPQTRVCPGLPGKIHPSNRHRKLQNPNNRYRRYHVPIQRPRKPKDIQSHATPSTRVHPPLSHPCASLKARQNQILRAPCQSVSKTAPQTMQEAAVRSASTNTRRNNLAPAPHRKSRNRSYTLSHLLTRYAHLQSLSSICRTSSTTHPRVNYKLKKITSAHPERGLPNLQNQSQSLTHLTTRTDL